MLPSEKAYLRDIEAVRLRALVERDLETAARLHADDYVLITPRGTRLSKTEYLEAIESGDVDYEIFEAVSEVDVLDGDLHLAVLRYRADIRVGSPDGRFSAVCWHTDCYRRTESEGWRVVWSQATAIEPDVLLLQPERDAIRAAQA